MITFPNAKINLGLDVVCRRSDGYHDISTLFYPVPLCDILEMTELPDGENPSLTVYGNTIDCPPEKNLVMKAYRAMAERYEIPSVAFYLVKKIPDGAGLGGGSADAAFAIRMLRDSFLPQVNDNTLAEIAATIGADCPFFIYNKPMYATGIGDILTPVPDVLNGYTMLLVKPDVYVSTKEAYSMIHPASPEKTVSEIVAQLPDVWKTELKNDFEPGVFAKFPVVKQIKQCMYDGGAVYASMSGSGSSVYGIFESVNLAESLYASLDFSNKFLLSL